MVKLSSADYLWKLVIGMSVILFNVSYLPNINSKFTQFGIMVATLTIAILIMYYKLLFFGIIKEKKDEKTR